MSIQSGGKSKSLSEVNAHFRYQTERFESEARFADSLCDLHPDKADEWKPLIAEARKRVFSALSGGSLAELEKAVSEAEALLAPLGGVAKSYTIHCVGHAHIDMNWMWSWPETVAVINDSFLTVLRLMEEFPEFHFSQSQASVYASVEKHNPEMLERIAQRVKEGRWEVTASHWVENDNNIAGGESLTRHLLYTRQHMHKLFGISPEDVPIDWCPDTFGHARTLPTYLVRGGIKYIYLHRPGVYLTQKPDAFWWSAPDGSRVLAVNHMNLGYNMTLMPGIMDHLVKFAKNYGGKDYMIVYGVGDHGGGPTRRDLSFGLDMNKWPIFPNIRLTTAKSYYEKLEKLGDKLPTLDCELNTEFTGCYTTQSLIKKICRFGEARLKDAEAASTMAWGATGLAYPNGTLRDDWVDILFNHFHDILPGSGVHDTRTYAHGLYQTSMASVSQIETKALRSLASRIDTVAGDTGSSDPFLSNVSSAMGAGVGFRFDQAGMSLSDQTRGGWPKPFMLFNPLASDREEVIEATLWDNEVYWDPARPLRSRKYHVTFPDGSVIPAQMITAGNFWGHEYAIVAFPALIPSLGYSLVMVDEVRGEIPSPAPHEAWLLGTRHHCEYAPVERSIEGLENEYLRVELDSQNGGIKRLIDKKSGKTIIENAPLLEYAVERSHGMSAWSVDHTGPTEIPVVASMTRSLPGPHKVTIEVKAKIHSSDMKITYELRAGDPMLYIHISGVWFERGTPQTGVPVLSYVLPLSACDAKASYEIPFGSIERGFNNGEELPALQWAKVSGTANGEKAGCALLNDTKHGYSLKGNTLRLTLIRSSYEPDILPEIGSHEIHLALLPFAGEMDDASVTAAADRFNRQVKVVSTDIHEGSLPRQAELVSISPANVTLSGLKKAEDDDAVIVRVYESEGRKTDCVVRINESILGKVASVTEVDLMERPIKSNVRTTDNSVTVTVPAYGIASLRISLTRS